MKSAADPQHWLCKQSELAPWYLPTYFMFRSFFYKTSETVNVKKSQQRMNILALFKKIYNFYCKSMRYLGETKRIL